MKPHLPHPLRHEDRFSEETSTFLLLTDYKAPDGPTVDTLQRVWMRVRNTVFERDEGQAVEDDRLRQASHATVDHFTDSPDCALLGRELDETLERWIKDVEPTDTLRLFVTPPADVRGLLDTWARRRGHALLEPPPREALTARPAIELPPIDGEGVLVVARLEQWFRRHRHGLDLVRGLLAALAGSERRCVIGCSSWAWSFLRRAVGADLLLPEPLVFTPFDADRLSVWFAELADAEGTRDVTFRASNSGGDVFARDADGELESDYLQGLAARSLGIPWVAWQLWRRALRTMPPDEDAEAGAAEEQDDVLWLVRPDEFVLPHGHERVARIVLQALLVHGSLDTEELALVLPIVGESNIVPALVRAGFVERVGTRFRCVPAAYPAIISNLSTAGFTMPVI